MPIIHLTFLFSFFFLLFPLFPFIFPFYFFFSPSLIHSLSSFLSGPPRTAATRTWARQRQRRAPAHPPGAQEQQPAALRTELTRGLRGAPAHGTRALARRPSSSSSASQRAVGLSTLPQRADQLNSRAPAPSEHRQPSPYRWRAPADA